MNLEGLEPADPFEDARDKLISDLSPRVNRRI